MLQEWIRHSVEWNNWGMNVLTVSFMGTVFFTFLEIWGLVKQDRTIRDARSGEGVSVSMISYFGCTFIAFGYFGFTVHSIASVFNGVILFFFYLKVLLTLKEFKVFSTEDKWRIALFASFALLEFLTSKKELVMTSMMVGAAYPLWLQVKEIWVKRSVGQLDIRYISVMLISTLFWTVYAFVTHNLPLMIVNPFIIVLFGVMIHFWFKFRRAN